MQVLGVVAVLGAAGCSHPSDTTKSRAPHIKPGFVLRNDQSHNKFGRRIEPVLRVPFGSIIEALTHEATGGQSNFGSTDPTDVNMDLVHTLTGPVYVDGAGPGDVLSAELFEIQLGDWG